MTKGKWDILEDKRYDSEVQICLQCNKFHLTSQEEEVFGVCSFLNCIHSPNQLEWAVALSNMMCNGFEFKEGKRS